MKYNDLPLIRTRVISVLRQADESDDPETKTSLACFACILTSAMLEVACRYYVALYVARRAAPTVCQYIDKKLYGFQNAEAADIDKLLRSFSPDIADEFSATIGDEVTAAINSVVGNKNQLAHGKGAGLGLATMVQYHKQVVVAIDTLKALLTNQAAG
jgi:hypothetical protein